MDLETLPVIKARWYQELDRNDAPRHINHIVVHAMQAPEKGDTAEAVGKFFQRGEEGGQPRKTSAHVGVDSNTAVRYVPDRDVAYAAPGANRDGLHLEFAGYISQTREQWLDAYGLAMLNIGADIAAQWVIEHDVPIKHLTNYELRADQRGFVGHDQVSSVYQKSDHTDPGPNFPFDYFLERVTACVEKRQALLKLNNNDRDEAVHELPRA